MSWLIGDRESGPLAKEVIGGAKKIEDVPEARGEAVKKIIADEAWRKRWGRSGFLGQMPKEKQ